MSKAKVPSGPSLSALGLSLVAGVAVVWIFQTCSKKELPAVPVETPSQANSSVLSLPDPIPETHSNAAPKDVLDLADLAQFQTFLDMGQKNLAKVEDLKKMKSEDLHHTPQAVLGAGKFFVKVLETTKLSNDHLKAAQDFFSKCVLMEDVVNTLRATCLVNLRNLHVEAGGNKEDFDDKKYPEKIRKLSKGF